MLYAEIVIRARGARIAEVRVDYVPRAGRVPTGARPDFVLRTGRDMPTSWLHYRLGRRRA